MADDFDPTGMTIQQLQDAGHDVSLPDQQTPAPAADENFDPTGMTIDQLQSAGVSIAAPNAPPQSGPAPEGSFASMLRAAAHSVIPTAAALPGMIAGGEAGFQAGVAAAPFLGPLAPVAPPAGALIGGAIGGMIPGSLAAAAQEKALNAVGFNDEAQQRANAKENPISTAVGEFAPALATFEVGDLSTKLAQRLLMGGGMGALDIAQQKIRGEPEINYSEAATQAIGGAILGKPRGAIEPMAKSWARAGQQFGENIPGVEAGREFLNKTYPPGRPDLSEYNNATSMAAADKDAVQPYIPATSPNRGAAGTAPPPKTAEQPFTGYDATPSAGNKDRQFKPELQPQATEPSGAQQNPFPVVNSQADDPAIAAAMQKAGAGTTPPEEAPPQFGPKLDAQFPRREPQPAPPPVPRLAPPAPVPRLAPPAPVPQRTPPSPVPRRGLTPEDQQIIVNRQLPFAEQLKQLQALSKNAPPPPAAQAAIETSKAQAPQEAAGALNAKPVEQTTPQKPPAEATDPFAQLTKILAPSAQPAVPNPVPGRFTNMEVSNKTIKALRATGNDAYAKIADKLDALPPGHDREHEAARVWAAMHSQTGELPTEIKNIRVRNPEVLDKLAVKGYTNPVTGKPVRTGTVPNAIMYSKIHEINDRIHNDPDLQPAANEDENMVRSRAQDILDTAKAEAKAEAAKMLEEARRPGSNLSDKDKNHLIAAATKLGNGKLPVENYTMSKLMKPPAWRMQRMAKDLLEKKIPPDYVTQTLADGTTQRIVSATPEEKFLANERLIRGSPDDYAEFVKNNIAEAATAKKTATASDVDFAEAKNAARQVAQGKTTEQAEPGTAIARPITEEPPEETLGERTTREQKEDRILDKLRSMKYDSAADRLEKMPLGPARDNAFKYMEAQVLKTTRQGMARKKIPRPSDSLGFDKLNEKILAAGLAKVKDITDNTVASKEGKPQPNNMAGVEDILTGKAPPPEPPKTGGGKGGKGGEPPPDTGPYSPADYGAKLEDRLMQYDMSKRNYQQQIKQIGEGLLAEHPELMTPEVYDARTKQRIEDLPPATQDAYNKVLLPMELVNDTMFDNLRQVAPDQVGPKVENYTARILLNGEEPGSVDPFSSQRSPDAMVGRNLKPQTTGTLKPRSFYGMEYADGPRAGKMQVMSPKEGEGYTLWNDYKGTSVKDPDFQFEEGKEYTDPDGQKFIMRQAPEDLIEKNALLDNGQPPQYARNLPLSILKANSDAVNFALGHQFFNSLKNDPEFKRYATTNADDPRIEKYGWKKTNMPTFKPQWYMEPKLADILDDYYKPGFHDDSLDALRQVSQAITRTIYLFPTVHLLNVAAFGFVQRGSAWLRPAAFRVGLETGTKAIKSVLTQDDLQKDLRQSGLVLMSGFDRNFMEGLGKAVGVQIKSNPRQFQLLAKILGQDGSRFVQSVYDKSSHAMWTASDVIVTQAVLEREAQGMSRQEAIRAVERIIPNYRIGTQFISNGKFGRFAAKLFSDPATMAFGPYHVGVVRAFGNMLNDAVKGTGKQRTEALAQLTMMAVLAFAVKPVLDKAAQLVTGNPGAELRPPGPLTIPTNLVRAGLGEKDVSAALRDTFTIPPLANTAQSLIRNQTFNGRPIVQPEDIRRAAHGSPAAAGRAAVAAAEFAARGTIAPYNLAMGGLTENKQSLAGVVRDQMLGIDNPSDASVRFQNLKPKYDLRARKQEMKTEKDPVKRAYDALFSR